MASSALSFAKFCLQDREKRRITLFLFLNLGFTVVEIFYGWISHSLGLIGDGFHMFFDSSVILANLVVMFVCSKQPSNKFSLGYGRSEAMAGFINAILLVYSSVSILIGALERVVHPHFEIHSQHLISVSVIGLLVNVVGLFAFGHEHETQHHAHFHNGKRCCAGHEQHRHNFIRDGMFMHVAADTLGSVAVIISSLVIKHTGWLHADTLCSVILALLILAGVRSLLMDTFHVLLNGTPKDFQHKLSAIHKEVSSCLLFIV